MTSLALRNIFFTILQPGLVTVLIPWLLVNNIFDRALHPANLGVAGLVLIMGGWAVLLACIYQFARDGRGTLSPLDPTKKLVAVGLYKYSRNPMYVAVTIILAGECLLTESLLLIYYTFVVFITFNIFIHLHEEPRMKKDFGDSYLTYKKQVRRWL